MPSHSESRIVSYPAEFMLDIVADVERYPEFVPWCDALRVLSREREGDDDIVIAQTTVGFKGMQERYTSRARLDRAKLRIDVVQTEGVFKQMETHWRFIPMGDLCKLEFSIMFEFKSRLLTMVAGKAFGTVVARMTQAFEKRARRLSKQALK
ncbi:MAG TPA: type II toxin-antitoxin system RatA family toxin [Rhizomicrobium sp.]